MKKWDELPIAMQNEKVRYYYDILQKHETELKIKRLFDVVCSFVMIVILSPILVLLSIMIKLDSKGPVLFKQVRVTTYGRKFKIWKFRTMVNHADNWERRLQLKEMRVLQEWDICLERFAWMSCRSCLMS